ncbi:RHS repeat protein [Niabella pedocola]|uniref:RHS repeat protein n=1 Tax=Niabella pedocola TaxID=1752077 RepID=A0ABS8PTT0_9BACT|nr:RHS repeat domain-containing protein [Niabella pedocola]MCD2424469.1 RHS repeat protein [Niabella pedocola]
MRTSEAFVRIYLTLGLIVVTLFTNSQQLPNIIPPAPLTRELNKYVDFPVDYSTGVPEIAIQLYTIKMKELEIPIVLRYHASGIKNGQDDGNVGLGWSLNCDYRISRTIYGQPDSRDIEMNPSLYQSKMQYFENNLYFPPISWDNITLNDRHALYPFQDRDKFLGRFLTPSVKNGLGLQIPSVSEPLLDGEYDHFSYMSPGGSGKFIISDRVNKIVSEINPGRNRFTYLEGTASNMTTSGIIGFTIKDENQNKFSFGEQVDKLGARVLETNIGAYDLKNVTAWALTDIDTKYGEKVKFQYESKAVSSKYKRQVLIRIKDPLLNQGAFWSHSIDEEAKRTDFSCFSLSSIHTPTEYVEFDVQNQGSTYRVNRITVRDSLNQAQIKRIDFYYHPLFLETHSYTFLDSIRVYGKDMADVQTYKFDYYDADDYAPGFLNNYLVPDQWGYNKVVLNPHRLLNIQFGNDHARADGEGQSGNRISGKFSDSYPGYLERRDENPTPELFSLKRIKYPTGGSTVYEYEPNLDAHVTPRYLGGIRIRSISHFDGNISSGNSLIKSLNRYFLYEGGYSSAPLDYTDFRKEFPIFIHDGMSWTSNRGIQYSSNYFGDRTESENVINYSKVTELVASDYLGLNGKVTYRYSGVTNTPNPFSIEINDPNHLMVYYLGGPTYIKNYRHWQKPVILEKNTYDKDGKLLKGEQFNYQVSNQQTFTGLKVIPYASVTGSTFDEYFPVYYAAISSMYNHGLYSVETGNDLLKEKKEVLYTDHDSITTTTIYDYNNLNQVTTIKTFDSKNDILEKSVIYPANIPYDANAMLMLQANDVNKVLEESGKKNNTLISQSKNQYVELPGGHFVLSKIQRLNSRNQALEDVVLFKRHDSKGNVQSLSKEKDMTVNYLWGYNYRFPIAEIKGVEYEEIESIIGVSQIEQFVRKKWPTLNEINQFLIPIRNAIQSGTLKNVILTSFSYDLNAGLKTQTDSGGRTVYYEYDAFNRLSAIKDDEGRVIKKIEHHYSN